MPKLIPHHLLPDEPFANYDEYAAATGENAVLMARTMGVDAVLREIQKSKLRGRGGAGFPTGVKWSSIRAHPCPTRDVVCNAGEGEPGTFKDRFLLRKNPYATLEGMIIAAAVVDARKLFVVLKASFEQELERLRSAADEMDRLDLFGALQIEFVEGPEEYLLGEEKALLEVIEGNDPLPREAHYPPYERGLFATPTSSNPALVNNAQTFAHVPGIVRWGFSSFAEIGTEDTPGTILFTVSGDVKRPGVYELPAGITLRFLFEEIAGGPREGRQLKAAIVGASSAVIEESRFDTPADFASLHIIGASLGSAGFVVFDDRQSMPRVAQTLARFLYVESCNQCPACKHGLRTSSNALDELFDPALATNDDLESALYGARSAPQGNRCYLPVQGSIVIPSLLSKFRPEFEAQLANPTESSPAFLVPKMIDFDEETRTFLYDLVQPRKRPDWTYEEPEPTPLGSRSKASSPGTPAPEPVHVRLSQDVRERIAAWAEHLGEDAHRMANRMLRAWSSPRGVATAGVAEESEYSDAEAVTSLDPRPRAIDPKVAQEVLIAVDASEASELAVQYVGRLLRESDLRIRLLNVLPPIPPSIMEAPGSMDPGELVEMAGLADRAERQWTEERVREVTPTLEKLRQVLLDAGIAGERVILDWFAPEPEEAVPQAVLKVADECKCETVVVGHHALPWYRELFRRHVGEQLVRHAQGHAILVVK